MLCRIAFFVIVYGLYLVLTHRYQNALLLIAEFPQLQRPSSALRAVPYTCM